MTNKRSREASFSPSADSPSVDEDSNISDERGGKISALASESDTDCPPAMQCSLPPHAHALSFASIAAFEVHYQKDHTNRCTSCAKNFPSAHFLALHIDELHNPLRAARESKGEKTYGCFVKDCEKLCSTPQKRRLHLIDKHMFPKSYNFRVVEFGIDRRTSMLNEGPNRRRVSITSSPAGAVTRHRRSNSQQFVHAASPDRNRVVNGSGRASVQSSEPGKARGDTMAELADSLSALQFLPPSIRRRQEKKDPS